jgi:peptide/nickel transport system permease protein
VGLLISGSVILVGLFGSFIAPYSPTAFVGAPFALPSQSHLLGTDELGRDVLSRVLAGGRTVVILGFLAATLAIASGTALGLIAAQRRGVVDEVIMRLGDILLAFPQMILALLFVSVLGSHLWLIVLVVGLSAAPQIARIMRTAAASALLQDYIAAAQMQGASRFHILLREVLPNILAPLRVQAGLRVTYSVQIIAALSFLGLGVLPPQADWGLMIGENRLGLTSNPWSVLVPVMALALLTIGMTFASAGDTSIARLESIAVPGNE